MYDAYQHEREWGEYLAAQMPFTYVQSKSKRKVKFSRFMSCYGRGGSESDEGDDLMSEVEMAARIESLAQTHGGTLTKKGK